MSVNRSHRTRLARALAERSDLSYQAALDMVTRAADTGQLPAVLNADGFRVALDRLLIEIGNPLAGDATDLPARYHRLGEVGGRLERGVAARAARATAAGALPVRPMEEVDFAGWWDEEGSEPGEDWFRRLRAAGTRRNGEFAPLYPARRGTVPIDEALDRRDHSGDLDRYEADLIAITEAEPYDIDAWAHLGNLYFAMAGPDDEVVVTPPPKPAEVRGYLRTALGYYQTAVAVGELSIPDPYPGLLTWGWIYNRPFFRALHGVAVTSWRLDRRRAAEATLLNMLWLNPDDNQGARHLLHSIRSGAMWEEDHS